MTGSFRKWLLSAFLLGALAFVGVPSAQAQYRRDNHNRRDTYDLQNGWRGDFRDYQREIRILQDRIWRDKEQLRFDIRRFGKRSFQVRADRQRLDRDQRQLKWLKQEMKRDRLYSQRRNFRGRW